MREVGVNYERKQLEQNGNVIIEGNHSISRWFYRRNAELLTTDSLRGSEGVHFRGSRGLAGLLGTSKVLLP